MDDEHEKNGRITERLKELGFLLHPPDQTLYKYVDIATAKLILENGTLMYQTPEKFNDPLDPHFALIDMSHNIKQRAEKLAEGSERNKFIEGALQYARQVIKKHVYKTGILCLSIVNTDTLMWSHYGKAHTGACIGFKYLGVQADGVSAFKVKYDDEIKSMPFLTPVTQDSNFIAMMNLLCRKAKVWKYEQEVRIAKIGKAGVHPIHPGYVCEVYFGVNTKVRDIEELGQLLVRKGYNNNNVRIGQMILSEDKFELDIKPLTF